jgi:hypothetical protein
MRPADLSNTKWVAAADLHAGMEIIDWHDGHGHGVFGFEAQARRVVEVEIYLDPTVDQRFVRVTLEDRHNRLWTPSQLVEVHQ